MDKEVIVESIKISNPDKLLFHNPDITKEEVVLYYQKVAQRMLPYIKNRILSSVRCPSGIEGECFYKKHLETDDKGIKMIVVENEKGEKDDYYYITALSGLIAEVQMNTIEFHVWGSKYPKIDKPDMMVFDLDPDEKLDITKLREGVKDLKSILDELSLVSFLKTSGGKGYHIVIPFKPSVSWSKFRNFAKNIALLMENKWPNKYTSNMRKSARKNKIYIDWVRNAKSATSIAPYSLRIKKNAPVSIPIKWNELDKIAPNEITIKETIRRLKNKDPWENFFNIEQYLK